MLNAIRRHARDLITNLVVGTPIRQAILRAGEGRAVIFTLHRVSDPEHGIRGHELKALADVLVRIRKLKIPVLGMHEVLKAAQGSGTLPPVCACFTLDDGYWDQAELTVPLLLEHGVPPTVFLITGFLDGQLWPWDARVNEIFRIAEGPTMRVQTIESHLQFDISTAAAKVRARHAFAELCKSVSDGGREQLVTALAHAAGVPPGLSVPPHHRPMTWDQARYLERQGVRFGSHSVSHCVFSRVSDEKATAELEISGRRLVEELREPLPILAWPIGRPVDFGARDLSLAKSAGYAATTTVFTRDFVIGSSSQTDASLLIHRHGFSGSVEDSLRILYGLSGDAFRLAMPWTSVVGSKKRRDSASVDWGRVQRLVFVCKGNICRSAYAEGRAKLAGLDAVSCGVEAAPGAGPDGDALRNGLIRGVNLLTHRSQRLDEIDLCSSDLVVYMEPRQASAVARHASLVGAQHTLASLWTAFDSRRSIGDPFGKDDVVFQAVFERLDEMVANMAPRMAADA